MVTPARVRYARARTAVAEKAEALLRTDFTGMTARDRAAWASARTWPELGERVVDWLNGRIIQTPGHGGPPCEETIPHIPVLTAVNRAGFVTDNSQSADGPWVAWVSGFAPERVLSRLRVAIAGTPVEITQCCRGRRRRGRDHGHGRSWLQVFARCPVPDCPDFWADRCPALYDEIWGSWYVTLTDPEPGRNDRLWPALADFADLVKAS